MKAGCGRDGSSRVASQEGLERTAGRTADPLRSLVDSLQRHRADVVYVLNSTRSDAAPSSIASLAGVPSEESIVPSEAQGCLNDSRAERPTVQQVGNAVHIVSVLPGCASYEFSGVPLLTIAQAFRGVLSRGHFATYSLPEGQVTEYGRWIRAQSRRSTLGKNSS
jgi:hypothetical protein